MAVRKFAVTDASFERSPGQDGDVFAANVIDQRDGAPISIGFGRYLLTAGPGEVVYMPKGESVTIRSHEQGATTAYVTYPHWQEAK